MLNVCCAIILDSEGRVLVTQRSPQMHLPLKWEFPGGKVQAGETAAEALHREIMEELGVSIDLKYGLQPTTYAYPDKEICLIPFVCSISAGLISLKEHLAYAWHQPADLLKLDLAAADVPLVHQLLKIEGKHEPKDL